MIQLVAWSREKGFSNPLVRMSVVYFKPCTATMQARPVLSTLNQINTALDYLPPPPRDVVTNSPSPYVRLFRVPTKSPPRKKAYTFDDQISLSSFPV